MNRARIVIAAAFAAVAVTGGTVLLLPHGPVQSQHAAHEAAALPASSGAKKNSEASLPTLGFNPVALTRDLATAVQRNAGGRVTDPQLLFRGQDAGAQTAGLLVCVVPADGGRARTVQVDLRRTGAAWKVIKQTASGVPC